MKWFEYIAFRVFVNLHRIIPFSLMYYLSDLTSFLIFYVIKYRREITEQNLKRSFPEKDDKEIKKIQKKFYRHLTDVFFETAKGMVCPPEKLCKRYKVINPEVADRYYEKSRDVIFLATHYGNWEWGIQCFNHYLKHQTISLYKPLKNKYSEKYGIKKRTRTGMKMVVLQKTKEVFNEPNRGPYGIIMAADQTPSNTKKGFWIDFMNQPTACIHGPEAYGRKLGIPEIFVDVRKVKRGYYEIKLEEIPFYPEKEEQGSFTCKYMKKLEQVLKEEPAYWLWSHKRWKKKVPENINKIKVECN